MLLVAVKGVGGWVGRGGGAFLDLQTGFDEHLFIAKRRTDRLTSRDESFHLVLERLQVFLGGVGAHLLHVLLTRWKT